MPPAKPITLIIRTAGTNCDRELAHAFELAGAATQTVHLNELIQNPAILQQANLVGFPGGFSYGDDIAAGRIFANRLRLNLYQPLRDAITRGVPMIGICNGFQVLAKTGLLPDHSASKQTATLADNSSGRFIAKWVGLEADSASVCIWTQGLSHFELPIAHGEGRFTPQSPAILQSLQQNRQIALRYRSLTGLPQDANPNGSVDRIAAVCDPSGLVLGLMPHPERFTHPTQHPNWTRLSPAALAQIPAGLRIFQNAVQHVIDSTPVPVASAV